MGIEYVYNNKCIYMNYNLFLINRMFLLNWLSLRSMKRKK